ncbi:MAG TPA: NAD(P)/FAD-dependent oxidoreductase [Thermoleophilaceae bacterium]|jgi:phytoene dehydrogenase-like protein
MATSRNGTSLNGSSSDWDAIVIGSGIGGLTTASFLQTNGYRTLVLEQYDTAGGCSQVFRRKNQWEFDVGLHYVGDCEPGGIFQQAFRALGCEGKIEWLEMNPDGFDRMFFPDFMFDVPRGWDRYRERLYEYFPSERKGIEKCTRIIQKVGEEVFDTMPCHNRAFLRVPFQGRTLMVHGLRSMASLFDSCKLSPEARAVISGQGGLWGSPPSRTAVMMAGIMLEHYIGRGAYYPKGGGQVPAAMMVNVIQTHGGKVRTGARVEKILIKNGKVQGVRLVDGEEISAPVVVSNADLKRTYFDLVGREHLPRRVVRSVEKMRMVLPIFTVYLGLDIDLRERLPNANLWWLPDYDIEKLYDDTWEGIPDWWPSAYIRSSSLKDPSNMHGAPPGHSNLEILSFVPPDYRLWKVGKSPAEGGKYSKDPEYRAVKDKLQEMLVKRTAEVVPELEDMEEHIVWKEASTPITQERYTLSTLGTPYGAEFSGKQMGPFRPQSKSPVKGLYLCGGNTIYCHGITGTLFSGIGAAGAILGRPDLLLEVRDGTTVFGDPSKITAGGPDWDPLMSCRRLQEKPRAKDAKQTSEAAEPVG